MPTCTYIIDDVLVSDTGRGDHEVVLVLNDWSLEPKSMYISVVSVVLPVLGGPSRRTAQYNR